MKLWHNSTRKIELTLVKLLFLFFALLHLGACSTDKKHQIHIPEELEDYYEFQGLDLSNYGIKATIMLPDETANIGASTTPEITQRDSYYWNIMVGQNFLLHIEDYGDITDLVQEHREKLDNTSFYEVKYLLEEKDLIIYEIKLKVRGHAKASKSVGIDHTSYHVYGERVVGGIHYELRSSEEGFNKQTIELMAKSIRSFKDKKA